MESLELGERLGRLDAISQEGVRRGQEMMQEIHEIKDSLSDLHVRFVRHMDEDAATAQRISNIETSIDKIEKVTTALHDKHTSAMNVIVALKWLVGAIIAIITFGFTASDHIKEHLHR
jgi:hypothetical protein